MAVTTKENVKSYACDDSTTDFDFPFSIIGTDTSVLKITIWEDATSTPTVLAEESGAYSYSVSAPNNNYENGGTISTTKLDGAAYVAYAWDEGYTITIERIVLYNQPSEFVAGGLDPKALEQTFDHQEFQIQQLDKRKSIHWSASDPITSIYELPMISARKGKVLGFDGTNGDVIVVANVPTSGVSATPFAETLLDDANAATARATLGLSPTDPLTIGDLISKGFVKDIRAYDAIEDGSTDASTALQAAIDAAEQDATVERGRGVVLIPCVTGLGYQCDADIQLKNQIIITGGGLVKFSGTYGFESNDKDGWVIDRITLRGSETANQTGIYVHNTSKKFWIKNCQFYDLQTGVFVTRSWIFRIDDNDMFLSGAALNNIVCIKLTNGEGNCSKGTAYDVVNDVGIRGNIIVDYGAAPNTTPLVHIGDSALAPIDPKAITHAKSIDISANLFTGHLSENAIRLENTYMVIIERNWFETLVGPCVYLGGQWGSGTTIRGNSFWGNNNDDYMDPPIKVDSTVNMKHNNLTIANNVFHAIHANHNLIEADHVDGLVLDNNNGFDASRIVLTNCIGVDIREPRLTHVVHAFTDEDATPSVKFRRLCKTANTVATTITMFDDGTIGEPVMIIIDDANTTIDFTGTHLKGNGGANWSPASGDHMTGVFDGTDWFFNVSDNTA